MNIIIRSQNELIMSLEINEKLIFSTESLQSRNKVVSMLMLKVREAESIMLPYRYKFIDYIEILRAPPVLQFIVLFYESTLKS